ncbi:Methyl-accepting chemotaxis protein PctA [Tepidimonas thermarum]|uniref:Methyl-accepting chemotaxis protein PctA n=1 Tax=Tepidimonas thermarum TaxID=335431 RepID=A0A554WZ95_9BURK|nr:Methyl-accepting chemotaxis protein PctA [Tepidimonas thermarum]
MFDALKRRAAAPSNPPTDDVPSGLDSTLGEGGSTLGDAAASTFSASAAPPSRLPAETSLDAAPAAGRTGDRRPVASAPQADAARAPVVGAWAVAGMLAMAVLALAPLFAGDRLPLPAAWWPLLTAGAGALALGAWVRAAGTARAALHACEAELARTRAQAVAQQREAKRVNDATQAAILRLMNELQAVAEGDLTQQASVTEDITGAIADSVNYTVEELRSLVTQVQAAAQRVTDTTARVEGTSLALLAASTEQLREIRESGQAVLDMSRRITDVAAQAQASADTARQARAAAESGARAVQASIGGMNTIREQIQDTARRIKRLGESSQEIGEITDLIADITEQTNVLALNAAIQAASAGEAGRGFSVVAEEVQRLAERSADATRQIAALVRAIRADTRDAVLAMERSTHEVVEGTRLSDNAGAALAEIDRLSRQAAELVEQIAASADREAALANQTATSIQHILGVTEQTAEGTRSTVQQVRELARVADELRQSVARFKVR